MLKRKLIETIMPVSVINRECEREKKTLEVYPSSVHIWWSRTPMAVARAVLFAACVDDPSEHPELFPTKNEQDKERARLTRMVEAFSMVESADKQSLPNVARREMGRYAQGPLPCVFDPFAGSGSIPVEACRLGLDAVASDLNAVAATITTVVCDMPARFAKMPSVHSCKELSLNLAQEDAANFAEDVLYYGKWVLDQTAKRLAPHYPKVKTEDGHELDVSAWLWARTVKCPNPACNCNIPLSAGYDLARKKGSEAWLEPVVDDGTVRFHLRQGARTKGADKPKVAQKAVFKCPCCGEITTDAYIKESGLKGQLKSRLIAIVADDRKKRRFFEATEEQERAAVVKTPRKVPHGALPKFQRRFTPPVFGLDDYADLFTDRQLLFLTTMMKQAKTAQNRIEKQALKCGFADDKVSFADGGSGALAYAQAVRIVIVMTVSKLLDRCSSLCSWDSSGGGALRNVFSRAAMPMIWDFAEGNPFSLASGSFLNALSRTCDALFRLPCTGKGKTTVADASAPHNIRDALISTDLPYFDKASYADLSDFFYVWLKYGLEDLFLERFASELSPKNEELTAFSYRWNGSKKLAHAFYAQKMNAVFKSLYASASSEYPSTVNFIYKREDVKDKNSMSEWETFVTAVCDAGFMFTASWPLGRKNDSSPELAESRGIPITAIIRKKPADAPQITRRKFVTLLKRELPVIVSELGSKVEPEDLRCAVLGRALNIFSRYSAVLDADGELMAPKAASRIIEQELDTILSSLA